MAHASSAAAELLRTGIAIVGRGRMGRALAGALPRAGIPVRGPLGRGESCDADRVVLLCVPDREIAVAAAAIAPGRLVGHCSGATTLEPLAPHEAFSLHPLMTVVEGQPPRFAGAGCAIAGSSDRAIETVRTLARVMGMRPVVVADEHRVVYHAAAAMASNFLVTLESAAERLAAQAGVDRALLAPLVRAAVENWVAQGADSLTGPIPRGDDETVERHRRAIAERAPELLPMWEVLLDETRTLYASRKSER